MTVAAASVVARADVGPAAADSVGTAAASRGALRETLDALLARELPGGGWTYERDVVGRVMPITAPLRFAERIAGPLGLLDWEIVVLRSPGTVAAGFALLAGHWILGDERYLAAARRTGDLLLATQLATGGWFSEMPVEAGRVSWWFGTFIRRTNLDDDVTPGATRFLLALWEATGEPRYRAAAERALAFLLRVQLPGGAWPLIWRPAWKQVIWATFEDLPTLNDGATPLAIETLIAGAAALGRPDLLRAAARGGRWLAHVQARPPQAGWAQQYDAAGEPRSARRYEPAALASWESRYAVDALLALAAATGDRRFCRPVRPAVAWLARSAIAPGCWARFYEQGSNRPLYLDEARQRVDSPAEAHAPYDWVGDFGIAALLARVGVREPADGAAPRLPPGDPGWCPGRGEAVEFDPRTARDPRAITMHAARLVARVQPLAPVVCGGGGVPFR